MVFLLKTCVQLQSSSVNSFFTNPKHRGVSVFGEHNKRRGGPQKKDQLHKCVVVFFLLFGASLCRAGGSRWERRPWLVLLAGRRASPQSLFKREKKKSWSRPPAGGEHSMFNKSFWEQQQQAAPCALCSSCRNYWHTAWGSEWIPGNTSITDTSGLTRKHSNILIFVPVLC